MHSDADAANKRYQSTVERRRNARGQEIIYIRAGSFIFKVMNGMLIQHHGGRWPVAKIVDVCDVLIGAAPSDGRALARLELMLRDSRQNRVIVVSQARAGMIGELAWHLRDVLNLPQRAPLLPPQPQPITAAPKRKPRGVDVIRSDTETRIALRASGIVNRRPAVTFHITAEHLEVQIDDGKAALDQTWSRNAIRHVSLVTLRRPQGKAPAVFALRLHVQIEQVDLLKDWPFEWLDYTVEVLQQSLLLPTRAAMIEQWIAAYHADAPPQPRRDEALESSKTISYASSPTDGYLVTRWSSGVRIDVAPLPLPEVFRYPYVLIPIGVSVALVGMIGWVELANQRPPLLGICAALIGGLFLLALFRPLVLTATRTSIDVDLTRQLLTRVQRSPLETSTLTWAIDQITEMNAFDEPHGQAALHVRLDGTDLTRIATVASRHDADAIVALLRPPLGFPV